MLKRGAPLLVCLVLTCGAGPAAAGPMDGLFGNTLKITAPSGAINTYAYERDGAVTATVRGRMQVHGRWRLERGGTRLCQAFSPEPDIAMPEVCMALGADGKQPGDQWDGVSPTGKPLKFEIVAGQAAPR